MTTPVAKTYDWKQTLRTHGLRATPSTLATLQCLEHASQAMSHDDLTQQLEELLVPVKESKIGMYVCGVTVYDLCHLGHARTFV
ncbi:hypothetical protein M4B79_27430, partial [Klebsiella pneumoniae]|nr:hypothetical protein [Klebsiella pneumoniae]